MAAWANKFFKNEVTTTLTSTAPLPPFYGGEIVILYDGGSTTPTSTHGTYEVIVIQQPTYSVNLRLVEFVEEVEVQATTWCPEGSRSTP